jgi:hypothetical protein
MSKFTLGALSADKLDELYERITESAAEGREADVQAGLKPLLRALRHQEDAALCLVAIVDLRARAVRGGWAGGTRGRRDATLRNDPRSEQVTWRPDSRHVRIRISRPDQDLPFFDQPIIVAHSQRVASGRNVCGTQAVRLA